MAILRYTTAYLRSLPNETLHTRQVTYGLALDRAILLRQPAATFRRRYLAITDEICRRAALPSELKPHVLGRR